jgi:hypothetical protein
MYPHVTEKSWVDQRFNIWKNFTYKSICNQIDKNYKYILEIDELNYDYTSSLFNNLNDEKLIILKNTLFENKINTSDNIIARVDSDDLYRNDAIIKFRQTFDNNPDIEYVMMSKGYFINVNTFEIKKYYSPSGPFFAAKINNNLNTYKSSMDTPIFIGHGQVKHKPYRFIDENMAMVTSHDYNTDQWQFRQTAEHTSNVGAVRMYEAESCSEEEIKNKNNILKSFGLE